MKDAEQRETRNETAWVKCFRAWSGYREIPGYCYRFRCGNDLPAHMPDCDKNIKLKHNGNWINYKKLYCGFDIETTNTTEGERHLAFMYHWQFSISNDDYIYVFIGRTWPEFMEFMDKLQDCYKLDPDTRLIILDANFGFEFQFIRKHFDWDAEDFFAREERHPLKARTGGFEFHEVLSISGGNLAQLARDYTQTQKLTGDLDYKIKRNSSDKLDMTELDYCINDVVILSEFGRFLFDNYIIPDKRIPLTKTGILRSETRQNGEKMLGKDGFKQYRILIYEIFPDEKTYALWFRYLFRGGYVHANVNLAGYTIYGVDGDDITSSYPLEMLVKDNYPVSKFTRVPYDPALLKSFACIMCVKFTAIKRRFSISIESKSKCVELYGSEEMPLVIDNGRVAQGNFTVWLTELDFENYRRFYDWKTMEVLDFQIAERGMLPPFIRKTLAKYYKLKAELKRAGKQETAEYVIAKQKVNSFFGMMVTRIELDKISYDGEWIVSEKELDFAEEIKSQFLAPQWGIWVCANARNTLLQVTADITEAIGDGSGDKLAGVIYNDTDSIKVKDPDGKAAEIIERYNMKIRARREKIKMLNKPEFAGLGEFEHEGYYDRFKTLGAKRYLTDEHGKIKATIAGLPKMSILKLDGDPFDAFNADGMELQAACEIKNTISYNDEPSEAVINGELMHEESSAGIYNIGFTMTLDKAYYAMIVSVAEEARRLYGD